MALYEELLDAYETNTLLINHLTRGLTHADSLIIPPFPTNCVNWLIGHILVSRHHSLTLCGKNRFLSEVCILRYDTGTSPVDVEENRLIIFNDLIDDLNESQRVLAETLRHCSDAYLEADYQDDHGRRERRLCIRGLHWHETYHIGQIEILRSYLNSINL
jgi:hypothetical protein